MTLEERPRGRPKGSLKGSLAERVIIGGENRSDSDLDLEDKGSAKRNKSVEELLCNVSAECVDSVDPSDSTYLGKLAREERMLGSRSF